MTGASGVNILNRATARAACRDWGLSVHRLRAVAMTGAVLVGATFPSVVDAAGKSQATYLVALNPAAGRSDTR